MVYWNGYRVVFWVSTQGVYGDKFKVFLDGRSMVLRMLSTVSELEPMTKEPCAFNSCDLSGATTFLMPSWFCFFFISLRTWLSNDSRPT